VIYTNLCTYVPCRGAAPQSAHAGAMLVAAAAVRVRVLSRRRRLIRPGAGGDEVEQAVVVVGDVDDRFRARCLSPCKNTLYSID
jgi:hypothetical protein